MSLGLLLTADAELARVLPTLSEAALACAPAPALRVPIHLSAPGHSDDLQAERWGIIVPDTPTGEQLLTWLRPLCELRSRQCGLSSVEQLPTFKVAPGMDRRAAESWRAAYEQRHPAERPGYLVIAGDLDEVSLELQQEIAICASVGRLCFSLLEGGPDRAGYEAYCAKLITSEQEREAWSRDPQMLFYASQDGSAACAIGYRDLVRASYDDAKAEQTIAVAPPAMFGSADDHQWYARGPNPEAAVGTLLHAASGPDPAVLLSVTHGLGVVSRDDQRRLQGAIVLREMAGAQRTEVIDHTFFQRCFLPRGFWLLQACFSAGTPVASVYDHWLAALTTLGRAADDPGEARKYLAIGGAPFIARVPQVALSRPDGPLAVLAHVDLAWTYGVEAIDEATPAAIHGDHGPYYDVLRTVAAGHRFGVAVAGLTDRAQELGSDLALLYGDAEVNSVADDRDRLMRRAWTWMRYLDLAGYILLGDPAAQLPIRAARDRLHPPPRPPAPSSAVDTLEQAVLAYCQQRETPSDIAQRFGLTTATLEHCIRLYKEAGRRALQQLVDPGRDA